MSECCNQSRRENLRKEVMLSGDLNNLVEKRVYQTEGVADRCKSSVAGMSLVCSRDGKKITVAKKDHSGSAGVQPQICGALSMCSFYSISAVLLRAEA